jgi:hypothetical protein
MHTRSGSLYVFINIESGKHTGSCKSEGEEEEYYLKTIRPFSYSFPFPELTDMFDLVEGFLLYLPPPKE